MISFYKKYFRNMLEGNNMNRIFSAVIEMSAASIFIIPIFSAYGKFAVKNIQRTFIYFLL